MNLCGFEVGLDRPFFLIAGPCVIEERELTLGIAQELRDITAKLEIPFIFKASFDKANRTSDQAYRGPGRKEGLAILKSIRDELGVPVLTDVHSVADVEAASQVVDVLQIPAFLCRQTDLIRAAASSGLPVNIKKGQFLAPTDMVPVVGKARAAGGKEIMVCERGSSFGYNNLVVDMRGLAQMRETGCPVVFDATHSVQLPGGQGTSSGGQRQFVPVLVRAAVAVGVAGLFMETHPNPEEALSDGPNAWPLQHMAALLGQLKALDQQVKATPFIESELFGV